MRLSNRIWLGLMAAGLAAGPALAEQPVGLLLDAWDAAYVAGGKIGHIHTQVDRVEAGGKTVIHMRQDARLAVKRGEDSFKMSIVTNSYELATGMLYAIDSTMRISSVDRKSKGRLGDDGVFRVTTDTASKKETTNFDWSQDILGPYAHERMLKENPIKAGEARTFKTFLPDINLIASSTLKGLKNDKTPLRDGKPVELLLVEQTNDQIPIKVSLWIDGKGNIVKSVVPVAAFSMELFRVSRSEALDEPIGEGVDLGTPTYVKVDQPISNAHDSKKIRYRLEMGDEAAAAAISAASYQKIVSRSKSSVVIDVSKQTPDDKLDGDKEKPGDEYLASNGFIQADDPKIVAAAKEVCAGADSSWTKVQRLERWVHEHITNKDFNVGFASASEVMQTHEGDCTEHAVLLAALCRAAGIPARVAMGLVYLQRDKAFGYHMWTEVNIGERWYAADGTLGKGFVAGGHIKLSDGSLKGASAMSTFLPIFKVIGKLKIVVEAVE